VTQGGDHEHHRDDDSRAHQGTSFTVPTRRCGPNHYVQIVNKLWRVFDKNGVELGGPYAENVL
jgi:hypothetical protein